MGFLDEKATRSLAAGREAMPKDAMAPPRALERVRPFPWRSLQATTRGEVNALRDVRHWAAAHLRLGALVLAVEELVGAKVEVLVGRALALDRALAKRAFSNGVGVLIAPSGAPDAGRGALIEAETALAATLVARALGRPSPRLIKAAAAAPEGIAGAFAAVVLTAVRRAHAGVALQVLEAGHTGVLEAALAASDCDLLALSLTVLVADDAFAARVILSRNSGLSGAPPAWDARALRALGSAPLAIPVVACATFITPQEVASLRPGDAIVPRHWPIARGHGNGNVTVGPVLLAPAFSELGLVARLCEDGRLVLGAGLEPVAAREAQMDLDEKDAVVATIGEVPIVMRVEIGEALMTAREWSSLGRGDVVSLGRRVGETVLLRVGGIPMARGELVELDGEVAVRIVERLDGDGSTV